MAELTKDTIEEIVNALVVYHRYPKLMDVILKATISAIMRRMSDLNIRSYAYEDYSAVNTGDGLMVIHVNDRTRHVLFKKKEKLIDGAFIMTDRKEAPNIIRSYLRFIVAFVHELINADLDKPFLLENPDDTDEEVETPDTNTKKKYTREEVAELITGGQLARIMSAKKMKYFDDGIITIINNEDHIEYKLEVSKNEYYFTILENEGMLSKSAGDYRSPEHREWLLITIIMLLNKLDYDTSDFVSVEQPKPEDDCGCGADKEPPPEDKSKDKKKDDVPHNPLDEFSKEFNEMLENLTMGELNIIMMTNSTETYLSADGISFSRDNEAIRVMRQDGTPYKYSPEELFMSTNMLIHTDNRLVDKLLTSYNELLIAMNVI